jgi:hypothetical protein
MLDDGLAFSFSPIGSVTISFGDRSSIDAVLDRGLLEPVLTRGMPLGPSILGDSVDDIRASVPAKSHSCDTNDVSSSFEHCPALYLPMAAL